MFKKLIVFFGLVLCIGRVFGQDFPPKSTTIVTDYTHTLSEEERQLLERKLVTFNDSSSTQIAVVMLKSIGDHDVAEYAQQLGRKWGVGQKGSNNGIMILVAVDDHKMSIQVGYGLEGALPDIIAGQIIRNDITPRFKQGDYYGGLDAGTDDIIKYTRGEYKAENKPGRRSGGGGGAGIIVIIVVVILIAIFRNRGGGGGQVIGSRGGASPFWWFLAGSMLGGGGRGGDWGGFSGGGGDSGGGGFGGFGGGDFGGGGASGSW